MDEEVGAPPVEQARDRTDSNAGESCGPGVHHESQVDRTWLINSYEPKMIPWPGTLRPSRAPRPLNKHRTPSVLKGQAPRSI
eukprot:2672134-Pleurochrysis_carterae.AAC.2